MQFLVKIFVKSIKANIHSRKRNINVHVLTRLCGCKIRYGSSNRNK